MKSKTSLIATAIAVSGLTLALNAFAAPANGVPATQIQGEVTFLSGGVGQTEADAIKHVAKNYPLELVFVEKAKRKDEYLADVKVQIMDAHEKMMLNATSEGPFLLARMPAGKYTVSANFDGKIESRQIILAAKNHQRVVFEWRS